MRAWEQEIPGTPFERVLEESVIEVVLEPEGVGTRVTIAQRQKLKGYSRTGGFLLRRATGREARRGARGDRTGAGRAEAALTGLTHRGGYGTLSGPLSTV